LSLILLVSFDFLIKINLKLQGVSFEKVGAQIAQKFGLVHVDGTALLNNEVQKKTRIGAIISDCFEKNNLGTSCYLSKILIFQST